MNRAKLFALAIVGAALSLTGDPVRADDAARLPKRAKRR